MQSFLDNLKWQLESSNALQANTTSPKSHADPASDRDAIKEFNLTTTTTTTTKNNYMDKNMTNSNVLDITPN